jgi:hypothetical protein
MEESAMKQFFEEALDKEKRGLVKILDWEELKNLPDHLFPGALKVSPISAVPHKSRKWRAILDLSFSLKLFSGDVPSVKRKQHHEVQSTNWGIHCSASFMQLQQLPMTERSTLQNGM